ncbi:hypothetical protein [Chrysiogenes arsenatis]|uniref:hypothetical protein n=1 Tax=Chrysiogenes arsenatis TaxID=309797 RepID=UPI0003FED18C|nr:hypothetical protein [Chrysiogenes arsenatis]
MILNGIEHFGGLEFALFKLRQGVSEAQLLTLAREVEEKFLATKEGLLGHFLLKGDGGVYADVALASTPEIAKAICNEWMENETTLKYLEVIDMDSVEMSFWERIG